MSEIYLISLIVGIVAVFILIFWLGINIEDPVERAGKRGEEVATDIISRVLKDDDMILESLSDIDKAIHGLGSNHLSDREIDIIADIFD